MTQALAQPLDTRADLVSEASDRMAALMRGYGHLQGVDLLRVALGELFPGRIAAVSSFGAEAVVLLDMVSQVDRSTPVLFLETGKHFPETLAYRDRVIEHLGLTDVRSIHPDPVDLAKHDPDGKLHIHNSELCCHLRKVAPLERALEGFDAWITGRKRFHGDSRASVGAFEAQDGRIKVNPLAAWTYEEVRGQLAARGLPEHPLFELGYFSIGCAPCTEPVTPGEDIRSGRWDGRRTECGIHNASWIAG